jgi:hypothetical protein
MHVNPAADYSSAPHFDGLLLYILILPFCRFMVRGASLGLG